MRHLLHSQSCAVRLFGPPYHRAGAVLKAICLTIGLATVFTAGIANKAIGQNAESFVTSDGVHLYNLTYVTALNSGTHLFPNTPKLFDVPNVGIVVFTPSLDDTSLIGKSFSSVFNVSEADVLAVLEYNSAKKPTAAQLADYQTFADTVFDNYTITIPGGGETTVDGVLFSNGQDIGTIKLDPPNPVTIGAFGLALEGSTVPEPGPIAVALAAGFGAVWQGILLRRRRTTRR